MRELIDDEYKHDGIPAECPRCGRKGYLSGFGREAVCDDCGTIEFDAETCNDCGDHLTHCECKEQ